MPIVVIPQIVLAGVIAPLSGVARGLARSFVAVYWAQQSLERLLPEADLAALGKTNGNWGKSLAVVAGHLAVAAVLTIVTLLRSRRNAE